MFYLDKFIKNKKIHLVKGGFSAKCIATYIYER